MASLRANDFLATAKPIANAKVRLVCFPHSGGGPSAFAQWGDSFEDKLVEVVAISAPGRERRVDESPETDWNTLVGSICHALQDSGLVDDAPYAFFGHSLGALLAYETARRLDRDMVAGRPRPLHIFASGHGGPVTTELGREIDGWGKLHTLSDENIMQATKTFGFVPEDLASDKDLLRAVLPALRGDFELYAKYKCDEQRRPLEVPITVLGGDSDPVAPVQQLSTWESETKRWPRPPKVFQGGHFFLQDKLREVIEFLWSCIEETVAALPLSLFTGVSAPSEWPCEKLMTEVLEEWAQRTPEDLALVDPHQRLTFKEFVRQCQLLGAELRSSRYLDGATGKVIALLTPHNCNYVIGMLGIWYASGAIIVIEAHFPPNMVKEICEDAGTAAAVASPDHAVKFADVANCRTLTMDKDWVASLESLESVGTRHPFQKPDSKDMSILMMTSGTTGRPKTIAGSHYFMHLGAFVKTIVVPLGEEDHREAFNVMFVWEVLRSPLLGYTAYLLPDEAALDPYVYINFMSKHSCTRTLTTPSLLATIMDTCAKDMTLQLGAMRSWMMCGEVLPMKTVTRFRELMPGCKLVNIYSTWESGDVGYATVAPAGAYEPSKVFAAAGQMICPELAAVVVDPDTKQSLPQGFVGELYVAGAGLSYGYYGQEEATNSKFLDAFNPEMAAASKKGWKWYKTGDRARFVGEPPVLEIQGRIDSTVKIRGFKVGIPVVEGAVAKVPGVAMCAVVPVYEETGASVDSLLCVMKPQEGVDFGELVQRIKQEAVKDIPRWMMPSYYRPLPTDCFSGGESRKLNRRRLAELADLKALQESQALQPSSHTQALAKPATQEMSGARGAVITVWAKVLNFSIDMVDLEENFFDLGGHSALAARMATELSGDYGLPLTVLDIYSNSTLQALCDFVDSKTKHLVDSAREGPLSRALSGLPDSEVGGRAVPQIAVAGIAGKFPGADTVEAFWENLQRAAVSVTFLSKEFLRGKGVPEAAVGHKDFVPAAYMINDADKFDNNFFGIGRHEASIMDPQHRVFIEASWAAMENAALPPKAPKGGLSQSVVGVFAAAGIDGYLAHHLDAKPLKDTLEPNDIFFAEIGNEKDYIATRVSYLLDFTGPSMNVNSACSSALVAVSQGAAAMASAQCDAAVCGASSITFPNLGYLYAEGMVSSVDGYVRPFDAGADGTVFGDSVAAVVLRRIEDVGDGGLLYGKLSGFAVSNDGAQKAGYAAPSSKGQARALQAAMTMMKEDPWATSYVECHCTGTRVGDGIEIHGLISAFQKIGGTVQADSINPIALGSVKGNIAHANCAAGATGFIKVLKMMQQKTMVPTANFKQLNPKIDLQGLPFFVNSEVCAWKTKENIPLRAGVSSFGIGGTNAHTILEEVAAAPEPENKRTRLSFELLTFAAKTPEALRRGALRMAESLKEEQAKLAEPPSMANVAYTLQTGRAKLPLRKALVVPSGESQEALLKAAGALEENFPEVEELEEIEDAKSRPPVAFVFPGQGSQYLSMAQGLYDQLPLFRSVVDDCCEKFALPKHLGKDLRPLLWGDASEEEKKKEFEKPTVMQPALFIVEYALHRILAAVDINPIACAGHSLGEYAAAVVGGFLTLELAIDIVATRAKSTENLAEEGAMLSVADWSAEELEEISENTRPGLWLAAVNSPQHAVISGEVQAIENLEAELKAAGKKCSRLHVRRAFHSELVAKAADTLKNIGLPEEMRGIATTAVASNLTGSWLTGDLLLKGTYWARHMRGTVLWRDNAERIIAEFRPSIVLEVGPGNTLSTLTSKCVRKEGHKPEFVQMMRHPKATGTHDVDALLSSLGKLWETGCPVNWDALHTVVLGESRPPKLLRLPAYAFDPVSLWVNPERSVYVDVTEDPAPAAYIASEASARPTAASSRMLVRYGDDRETEPAIRAYCLPFASGSSSVFASWATDDASVEVIAVELPGRGSRSEEVMPADDAGDEALLDDICGAILADLRGAQLVLVGFSMGGGLSMELAFRLSAAQAGPAPLAVYVAGRKPPAGDPSLVPDINMTDSELAAYAFAPPEAAESPEFREFVLPLLRRDLEVDARAERRLSKLGLAGRRLPLSIGVELFCGTADTVAPWTEAPGWQRLVEAPVGIHYMPGGHEFMQEHRAMILAQWRRDAVGRLVQRRSAEVALLSQGLSAPGPSPALGSGLLGSLLGSQAAAKQPVAQPVQQGDALPLYAVRWQQAPSVPSKPPNGASQGTCLLSLCGGESIAEGEFARAVEAMKAGSQICVSVAPTAGIFAGPDSEREEVRLGWQFVELVQRLLAAGLGGKLLVICPASATGSSVAGASKAVAMEASELKFQRVFLPVECFTDIRERLTRICGIAALYSGETDIWLRDASLEGVAFVPRLERLAEPSAKTPCVRAHAPNGELATYLLTGATGGLGKAVVSWLIQAQGLHPSQLVLLRRAGSSKLEGEMAQCRVVEVAKVDCVDALQTALGEIQNICGLFHLAGVLDDGIVGGMTEERMRKVAQPKCAMLTALLNCSKRLRWPLQWSLGFSSTSSLFGYAGQVNYCAANAMLDQLAVFGGAGEASLAEGDRAPCRLIAVNWGPWGEAGMAQVGTKAYEQALKEGDRPLSTATALRCLAVALRQASQAQPGASQLCACDVEWEKSQWQDLPILEHVHDRSSSATPARAGGAEESGGSTESSVQGFLASMAKSGGGVWGRVKGKSLHQLGLDSLELVQLRNQFNKKFSVNVPLGVVADPSQKLGELAAALLKFVAS
eukprot:TRINITY_DN11101_c0_g2_i1.p1 TRINITY_DN11101_c0_g2~~TRINITY_DN11101_c0_g2_i1.p1  ORF type:complete len:2749 (+),score=545.09 TRINITY_DN11101_c0_g2_i1:120-8366(+)